MLKNLQTAFITTLWNTFKLRTPEVCALEKYLKEKQISNFSLDHFAIIDLPGPFSGIATLEKIFTLLGFRKKGEDYLAAKQNDFIWMADVDCHAQLAEQSAPQVVLADFRLQEMPLAVRSIILKYSAQSRAFSFATLQELLQKNNVTKLNQFLLSYFCGRDWPLPSVAEFKIVQEFNELLAWVLVFGRQPNHFSIAVHLLTDKNNQRAFTDLQQFQTLVINPLRLTLNHQGKIQGSAAAGIAQSSTTATTQIKLADGTVELPATFIEFVWRFPNCTQPTLWQDYFNDFLPNHADKVIESLYIATQ